MKGEELYDRLVGIVGPSRVKMDKFERLLYSHDLASLPKEMELGFKMIPDAVVRPKSAGEVSEIVKLACSEGIAIVPRGGASSGLGGAMPCMGGIVLDLTTMNRVLRVDQDNMEVEVEAGATWKKVYDAAMKKGLLIGSYPSSAPSATVGGWINTGGIGVGTYKYGSVGANLRNMEVVLPQGEVIDTGFNYVSDHSAGYNFNGMLQGAEGTLGIVTKATLRAYPAPEVLKPVSVMFDKLADAHPLMKAITHSHITPLNISFVDEHHLSYLEQMGKHVPGQGALLNLAFEGAGETVKLEEAALDRLIAEHGGNRLDDKTAQHEWDERYYEFRMREVGVSAALAEIVVPINRFPQAVEESYRLIRGMKMEASVIGLVGDRNTAMLMPYFIYNEKQLVKSMLSLSFTKKLGDIGFRNRGRPLGFGLFFAANLPRVRGQGASTMFDIKSVMDPHDIMNPGKMLEGLTRFGLPIPGFAMNLGMDVMAIGKRILPKDKAFKKGVEKYEPHEHGHEERPPEPKDAGEEEKAEDAVEPKEAGQEKEKPAPAPKRRQVKRVVKKAQEPQAAEPAPQAVEELPSLDEPEAEPVREGPPSPEQPEAPDLDCPTCGAPIESRQPKCTVCGEEIVWEPD